MLTVQIGKDGSYEIDLTDDSLVVTAELLHSGAIKLQVSKKQDEPPFKMHDNFIVGGGGGVKNIDVLVGGGGNGKSQ